MATLNISAETQQQMVAHAASTYPFECCGFFFGTESSSGERLLTKAIPVKNSQEGDQRRRFEVHPKDYLQAEQYATQHGLDLLGIYHSHPDHPAKPSLHDLKQAVPFFSYIILSVQHGEVASIRSWQLDEKGVFQEEKITENQFVVS